MLALTNRSKKHFALDAGSVQLQALSSTLGGMAAAALIDADENKFIIKAIAFQSIIRGARNIICVGRI